MPVHDWKRVSDGTFHHFHLEWLASLSNSLNDGVLPPDYYALAEQDAGDVGPDVLTLQSHGANVKGAGGLALALNPPKVRLVAETNDHFYVKKQKKLVIRHSSDDRIVALIEIVSSGNKAGRRPLRAFVDEAVAALGQGYHLLLVDLHPSPPRVAGGIHAALWREVASQEPDLPADKPLTAAAYAAGRPLRAFVEPFAVGDVLPDMPLFLTPDRYVLSPLETTYQTAFRGVPKRWRDVLEGVGS